MHSRSDRQRFTPWPPLMAGLLLLALTMSALAQLTGEDEGITPSASNAATMPIPSVSQLDDKLKSLESSESMNESLKLSLSELYRRTQSSLEEAANLRAKQKDLADFRAKAPKETEAIQRRLERAQSDSASKQPPRIPEALSPEEVGQRLSQVLADVTALENRINELDKLLDESLDRPTKNRARLIEVAQELEEIDEALNTIPASGEPPEVVEARRWALEARRKARWAESQMLEQDLLTQSVREAYYKAKRDEAALNLKTLKARQRALEGRLSELRQRQAAAAQQASKQAQREAQSKPPLVRQEIFQNVAITKSLGQIAKQLEGLGKALAEVDAERKRIEDDFRGARQRIEAVGLSKTLGQVLLDRRNQLPDLSRYRSNISSREDAIADATLRQIRYREEEARLRDLNRYANELIASRADADAHPVGQELRTELIEVLRQRKDLIGQALKIDDDYIRQLGELNYAAERVIQVAQNYDDFLAERLLWVRSASLIGLDTVQALPQAIGWLMSIDGWISVGAALVERSQASLVFWLGLAAVGLLFWKLSALRRAIRANAEPLRRVRTDRIRYTLQAIGLTLLAAAPLPLLLWVLGEALQGSPESSVFARSLGTASSRVALGLYYLLAFRALCITGGVADRHFRWSSDVLRRIRRSFDLFILYAVPISLVTIAIYENNDPAQIDSLGRLTLIANLLGFAVFFYVLLQPSTGVIKEFLQEHADGWLNRTRRLWLTVIVGGPLVLVALSVIGYVYTAAILFQSIVYQLWLALGLITIHQTIVRWLIVTRRRLALQAALERQAARRAQIESEKKEGGTPSEVLSAEEPEPDLASLDEQTRRLINASVFIGGLFGLWLTWSDVLPAFTVFDRFILWHYAGTVDGVEKMIPVTAADAVLVLIIVVIGAIAARNLPALLEIFLLQSASVSAGARYAIKTLVRYAITALAVLLAFSTLGLSWGQVQWLVAALGVGIGFGLQEIVANFISGIIILFERPVRVGDIVTIGDTTGVVSNISIRATTIRNWDKQELLVPNKEFITDRLLNWTLTDQQNRITIPVGVEYGSDTKKALALLSQVADRHERVLKDPAPLISFEEFGDNALTLFLRCYLDSLDGRIGVITDLHQGIYDIFTAHGIQIAFPQRDVRLFTHRPLDIRLQRAAEVHQKTPE